LGKAEKAVSKLNLARIFCLAVLLLGCSRAPAPQPQTQAHTSSTDLTTGPKEISEDQAFTLLMGELKRRHIADLDCLAFMAENDLPKDAKADEWEFAAREKHGGKCGGDPDTFPVRDRYKISAVGKVQVYDPASGDYTQF
jgi:hypothetical protein